MPDDPQIGQPESGDDVAGRAEEFFGRLGIPFNLYSFAFQQGGLTFADITAPPDPQSRAWVPLGARNIGGRVRALAQDPRNAQTLYAGTAGGGVWRTRDAGDSWLPLGQPHDIMPIGAIAIAPSDSDVVYIGAGEPVIGQGYPPGNGLMRYTPSSNSFFVDVGPGSPAPQTGLQASYSRIQVDPADATRYWAGSSAGLFRREKGIGIAPPVFRAEALPGGAAQPVSDVLIAPRDPSDLDHFDVFAAVDGVGVFRAPFARAPAPPPLVWTPLTAGFPAAGFQRIRLACCASAPWNVYAILEFPGAALQLVRSINNGDLWTPAPGNPDPGNTYAWYTMAIAVHPHAANVIITGGLNAYRSTDSGNTFQQILDWTRYDLGDRGQHADQHEFLFDAEEPHKLWIANDSGVAMCPDVIRHNPRLESTWRKRSHGVLAAQFNDITVNLEVPSITGGGLQDNGSYIGYGGMTWYHVGFGDGGELAFETGNPRLIHICAGAPPGWNLISNVNDVTVAAVGGAIRMLTPVLAEQQPPSNVMAVDITTPTVPPTGGLFSGIVSHHPTQARHLLIGRQRNGYVTLDGGTNWTAFNLPGIGLTPPVTGGNARISAVAYAPSAANTRWWCGSDTGDVFFTTNANATPWTPATIWPVPLPGIAGPYVSRIAVHPQDPNFVVVATGGNGTPGAGVQGHVYMTRNGGVGAGGWVDISGLAAVNGPAAGPLNALPPCPVTSLAFDPTTPAGSPEVLYAGTLFGVMVIRNLPKRGGSMLAAAIPAFNPNWNSFNNRVPAVGATYPGQLPLTLVSDLAVASWTGPPAQHKLRCATFGRGVYECDLSDPAPPGGTRRRLFIRQHMIEDGLRYPRPDPAALNVAPLRGDPRLPAVGSLAAVRFDETHAQDIRVDSTSGGGSLQFFDEQVDGVEFDEQLGAKNLVPGELNFVYVQLQTRGWDAVTKANIHLYFTTTPLPAPVGTAVPAGLPAPAAATFWNPPSFDPPAASAWQRAGPAQTVTNLRPGEPFVARFQWVPPANLPTNNVVLLALCESATDDALAGPPPASIAALIRSERRTALRIVTADPFVPDIFIRDGVEDLSPGPDVAFGGRSPDIIVIQTAPVQPLAQAFADLADQRPGDRLKGNATNTIHVRVHNRKRVATDALVELWWALPRTNLAPGEPNAPLFDPTKWSQAGIVGDGGALPAGTSAVTVPPQGWNVAHFTWDKPADPETGADAAVPRSYVLVALIHAVLPGDPPPVKTDITTLGSFWNFFRTARTAGNAAFRALRWENS